MVVLVAKYQGWLQVRFFKFFFWNKISRLLHIHAQDVPTKLSAKFGQFSGKGRPIFASFFPLFALFSIKGTTWPRIKKFYVNRLLFKFREIPCLYWSDTKYSWKNRYFFGKLKTNWRTFLKIPRPNDRIFKIHRYCLKKLLGLLFQKSSSLFNIYRIFKKKMVPIFIWCRNSWCRFFAKIYFVPNCRFFAQN